MSHLSEEQLVFHYYASDELESDSVEAHLAACPACRSEFQSLQRVLNVVDGYPAPERRSVYGEAVWRALEPKLGPASRASWWSGWPAKLAAAAAVLALIVVAFIAGLRMGPTQQPQLARSAGIREKVLLVALGDHLDRSQMILVELANSKPGSEVDISNEQRWADDLLSANRLYRQTAAITGDQNVAAVLDDLERFLVEVARSPSKLTGDEFEQMRKRMEAQGILFKVRVLGSRMRSPEGLLNLQQF